MVTSDLFYEADWSTGIDHLQSDHLPLHIVLGEADPGLAETDRTPKYQYQRANSQGTRQTEKMEQDPVKVYNRFEDLLDGELADIQMEADPVPSKS